MKIIVLTFLFFMMCYFSMAQSKTLESKRFFLSAGLENQLPVKTFANIYSYGIGFSPIVEYRAMHKISFTFNPSYVHYFYKLSSVGVSGSTGFITMLAGARYYFYKKIYLIGQGGLGIKISKFGKESALAFSGGSGITIYKKFDIQLKYITIKTSTLGPQAIALRLAYVFI